MFAVAASPVFADQGAAGPAKAIRVVTLNKPQPLSGEWEFYSGLFAGTMIELPDSVPMRVPGGWKGLRTGRRGIGTYRINLELKNETVEDYALNIGFVSTAYRLFVNGAFVGGLGEPGLTAEEHRSQWHPATYQLPPPVDGTYDIRIEVANHEHSLGGIRGRVFIGGNSAVRRRDKILAFRDWGLIGAFIFVTLFYGFSFIIRSNMDVFGWLALVSFSFTIQSGFNNSVFWNALFPNIPWSLMLRIEYAAFYLLLVSLIFFVIRLMNFSVRKWLLWSYVGVLSGFALFSIVGPIFWMTIIVRAGHLCFLAGLVLLLIRLVPHLKHRTPHAVASFSVFVVIGLISIYDSLFFVGISLPVQLSDLAGLFFLITMSISLANRFVRTVEMQNGLANDLAAANDRLELMVEEDAVTGLPNRVALHRILGDEIERAARTCRKISLLFVDLDNFKHVNDTFGHQAGDAILRRVSQRMHRVVRKTDRLFRLGGDEFIVLCLDLDTADHVIRIAASLTSCLGQTFGVDDREVLLGASIGVAVYPDHGNDPTALLRNADAAMYAAKRSGKGRYRVFSKDMAWKANEHVSVGGRLPRALQANLLSVVFQPQVDAKTMEMVSVEALLRWQDPELGAVPPSRFIPVAEESGLIVGIGLWVLEQSLKIYQKLYFNTSEISISVNLSAEQLTYVNLVSDFRKVIESTGFDPRKLVLEVTEHAVMRNWSTSMQTLNALRDLGIRIALDDFGTGYSSLGNIRAVPADQLKIDRSFVAKMGRSPKDEQLVRWITQLGHELDLEVCAEGIETLEQQASLIDIGVDLLQGFLYSEPIPPVDIFETVKSGWS